MTKLLHWIAATFVVLGLASVSHAQPSAGAASVPGSASASASGSGSAAGSGSGSAAASGSGSAAASAKGSGAAGTFWYDDLAKQPKETYGTFWMPPAVNAEADESDMMFYGVLGLSIFFFAAIAIAVVYLVIKYRHRPGHKAQPSAAHNDALEITWTVIPTIITVFLFYYGWRSYIRVVTPPTKAVEVQVTARRWSWTFTHENGVTDSDLHVPVGVPVRMVMTSTDVIHSFYIPVMRVKQDVIPRRYTYVWFEATKPGTYQMYCAEYCGTNHSQMKPAVVVHEPGGYERYLADKQANEQNMDPVKLGAMLYEKKGCNACHTIDGTPRVGPTWASHDWGQDVEMCIASPTCAQGTPIKIDESYLRESIEYPQAKFRKHDPPYPASMPSMLGQLKEKEIQALIAYIKALRTGAVK
jgi:cytochrome c oxidase subunit 2